MKLISFTLRGTCLVPDGTTESEAFPYHVQLPGGQLISVQPVVEMATHADADDYRDLTYDEAAALGVFLECEDRAIELGDDPG